MSFNAMMMINKKATRNPKNENIEIIINLTKFVKQNA